MTFRFAAVIMLALITPFVSIANAESSAAGHGKREESVQIPATVADILATVDQRIAALEQAIVNNQLAKVHGEAFAARDLLVALPTKATTLNPAQRKTLDAALGRIRQQATLLDKFGDAGDVTQTRAVFTRFKAEIANIRQQVTGPAGS
jgi:hypothetical protein